MDEWKDYTAPCGHASCTAEKRLSLRLLDVIEHDEIANDLAREFADAAGYPGRIQGAMMVALGQVIRAAEGAAQSHVIESLDVAQAPPPELLVALGTAIRREGLMQEALQGVPPSEGGEVQSN